MKQPGAGNDQTGASLTPLSLRVRFGETDQMGVAHHSSYVLWFEAGRVEWMRQRGMSYKAMEDEGISLAVAGLDVRYRMAAYFDDLLEIGTHLVSLRSRMVRFTYEVRRPADAALLASGSTVHVPTDAGGAAVRLPDRWLEPLAERLQPPP